MRKNRGRHGCEEVVHGLHIAGWEGDQDGCREAHQHSQPDEHLPVFDMPSGFFGCIGPGAEEVIVGADPRHDEGPRDYGAGHGVQILPEEPGVENE